jgi:uncharacterized protein (DUF952 family)
MSRRLFHLLPRSDWERFQTDESPSLAPPSLAREGFVHLSFAEQLAGTLKLHFSGKQHLVLLEIDPAALGGDLRLEPSRGGALFPHLHAPLERAAVLNAQPLEYGPDGWNIPVLGP